MSLPTDYSLGHFIPSRAWQEAKQTLDLIIETAEEIEDKGLAPERASKLYSIAKDILESSDNGELNDMLECGLGEINAIALGIQSLSERSQLAQVANQITSFMNNFSELLENDAALIDFDFQLMVKKKSPSIRIWEHNNKAKETQRLLESRRTNFANYPATKEDKEKLKELRVPISSMSDFLKNPDSDPTDRFHFLSEGVTMQSCSVEIACAIGLRPYMEDRYVAMPFSFDANGQDYEAELFGVFDGHNGSRIAEYVQRSIAKRLREKLELRLNNKDVNEDDIFYALKEAVSSLHNDIQSKGYEDGTTAVIGFKLTESDELWVANIGDSRAYLNRNGKLIPMSIDQKPYLVKEKWEEIYHENEYVRQLYKKDVAISKNLHKELRGVLEGSKMVLSHFDRVGNVFHMQLGITGEHHLDMTRSIGDLSFDKWKKSTPEIFRQKILPGDQLIMHSDGVAVDMKSVVKIVENDKNSGFSAKETVEDLVHASIVDGDNITAMIISFNLAPSGNLKEEIED